jgi:bacterioferritin-associated ferredoxin
MDIVCFCNHISARQVRVAIEKGSTSLESIYDQTTAGVGACGGSCRSELKKMLLESRTSGNETQKNKRDPQQVEEWIPPLEVTKAISMFNRRYYWETHEILEHLWLEEHGDTKLFYQGIIQAAAAFYHVLNANPKGVIKLAEDSSRKLSQFLPKFKSIPLEALVESLADFAGQAREILRESKSGFEYEKLPKIQILT